MATYPAYQIPSAAGITWASGPFPLQPLPGQYLCSLADAELILKAFTDAGIAATLVNAATITGYKFAGLDLSSPVQPWWIIGPDGVQIGPAGFAVGVMYREGVGKPGHWVNVGHPGVAFVYDPDPAPMPPPPATVDPNAANSFYLMQSGGAFGQADRDVLNDIRRLLVAMAGKQGIS